MKIGKRIVKGYIDFEAISEPWNVYALKDGSVLRFRLILIKVIPLSQQGTKGYAVNAGHVAGVLVPKKLKGIPSTPDTDRSGFKIDKKDIPFKVIQEEWNEYKLEDGAILKIKPAINSFSKSKSYDSYGDPIYLVNHQVLVKV